MMPHTIVSPDGPCRQVPEPSYWTSGLFITRCGTARRRHYNLISGLWKWEDQVTSMSLIDGERFGYKLENVFHSLERVIALAWKRRHPDSTSRVFCNGEPHARNIEWVTEEVDTEANELTIEESLLETWKPLTKHRVGAVRVGGGYRISSMARLMEVETGITTRGFYYKGSRFAPTDAGLLNLCVASGKVDGPIVWKSNCLIHAGDALMRGLTPLEYLREKEQRGETDVSLSTVWSYFTNIAPFLPVSRMTTVVPKIVSPDLYRFMEQLFDAKCELLGGRLVPLYELVVSKLHPDGPFGRSEFQYPELRLTKIALTARV